VDNERPVIAVDGRPALRWPRDTRGEVLQRLLTELGFLSRPYDLHIFGDLTADPDVLKKMRFLHPVDLLITPNDSAFEQMAFPQAAHGAKLMHVTQGVGPLVSRIPKLISLLDNDLDAGGVRRSAVVRTVKKARAVLVVSSTTQARLAATAGIDGGRVAVVPPAPVTAPSEHADAPKDAYVLTLMQEHEAQGLEWPLSTARAYRRPLKIVALSTRAAHAAERVIERKQVSNCAVTVPESSDALAVLFQEASGLLVGNPGDAAVLPVLNAFSVNIPVISRAVLPDIPENFYYRPALNESADLPAPSVDAQAFATARTWKAAAQTLHNTYLRILSESGIL
jgi:hypothetical protein